MSIEILMEGALAQKDGKDQFSIMLKELCEERNLKIEDYDDQIMIEVCPEGNIECSYANEFISLSAQTNIAGPGFHAYVCEFFDDILKQYDFQLLIQDPTDYYKQRNFETLKYNYFYRWLLDMREYVKEHKDESELYLCWPVDDYRPANQAGNVITPSGNITVLDFLELDIEDLAQRFFIWNDQERDAKFYLNCALSLLWKECYFEYSSMNEMSEKIGMAVVDYLEIAYELDPHLELPHDIYNELCIALQHTPLLSAPIVTQSAIGYRRNDIFYKYKEWFIAIPGCSEVFYDRTLDTLSVMAPYKQADEPWVWMFKIQHGNATTLFTSQEEVVSKRMDVEELGHGQIYTCFYDDYIEVCGELKHGDEGLLIQCILSDKKLCNFAYEHIKDTYYQASMLEHTYIA